MRIDVHQHLWTPPLLDALAERKSLPYVRRGKGLTVLHSAGEQPYLVDDVAESMSSRTALLRDDRLDRAVIAISSPIGIECLPRAQALTLIAAHLDGVLAQGDRFLAWGPIALDRPAAEDVDRLLNLGCVGISVPAGALSGSAELTRLDAVLARMSDLRAPLFVHPGRAPGHAVIPASPEEPPWWPALTTYVAQMQAAWLAFATLGRSRHPELQVVFSMLAGGAPLLSERLSIRGGPAVNLADPGVFYDTSGYGPSAVGAMAQRVGDEQLVFGSDRPVAEPASTGREVKLQRNAARLLGASVVAA